jgi:hypothetical protein
MGAGVTRWWREPFRSGPDLSKPHGHPIFTETNPFTGEPMSYFVCDCQLDGYGKLAWRLPLRVPVSR